MRFTALLLLAVFFCCHPTTVIAADADLPITAQRPLRYHPEGSDFVIENGEHWFNRPLYGPHTAFHIDAGDKPEFALLSTALKDGVLKLGFTSAGSKEKWLTDAAHISTRYRPGSLLYDIADPSLGGATLHLTALSLPDTEGLIIRIQLSPDANPTITPLWAFGGVYSLRRNTLPAPGDVITRTNVNSIRAIDEINGRDLQPQLMLTAPQCRGNQITLHETTFTLQSAGETVAGCASSGTLHIADAAKLDDLSDLMASQSSAAPMIVATAAPSTIAPFYLAIWRKTATAPSLTPDQLPQLFATAEAHRASIANTLTVDTPDPFINAVPSAICIAGDGCWQPPTWMHGAVSWHVPLLGWRGAYIGDALGWHDRADAYLTYWAARQNTADDFPTVARPNPARNLAENDGGMLHSNGSIPATHYDMNLVYIDALFRHLLWTGDRDQALKLWPTIQRHLAWEKRCFDRDGLYEGYACIWASDALQYNGGGAAHSTAYNEFHNRMAAIIAQWIGQDPLPYLQEANRIHNAMQQRLWMPDRGWYAEYQDTMGEKQLHPAAALWSIYHSVDSHVPDPFQAWQCMRYVDTSIAHIPVRGPNLPPGDFHVLPESNWMPYEWSLNNVVTAENTHTALAYWQSSRADAGFNLFKSVMLDTMYMGMTPGNLPNLSAYDPYRGETYTDFADPTGITARAFVEGLFGINPDAINGELLLRPGFPLDWDHAAIDARDLSYHFTFHDQTENWTIEQKFPHPLQLRLQLPARADHIESVQINGRPAAWTNIPSAIGRPHIEIRSPDASGLYNVAIQWRGQPPATAANPPTAHLGDDFKFSVAPAQLLALFDPQRALASSKASGALGHRTAFAQVRQGDFTWWLPIEFQILPSQPPDFTWQIKPPDHATFDPIDMTNNFNDSITRIFLKDYLTPRPSTCSLQMPLHGIGEWTGPTHTYAIDDTGLRRLAKEKGLLTLPGGIPFRTPGDAKAANIAFTSQWDNYPRRLTLPLTGRASHAYFLLAGSTYPMESQLENAEITLTYTDGTTARLPLVNPTNWWPIDKNYRIDSYAFRRPEPIPWRLALSTGQFYQPTTESAPPGGSATALALPLDPSKELKSATLHTESYEIVVGLMALTLQRP